jgi:hypothetical protein
MFGKRHTQNVVVSRRRANPEKIRSRRKQSPARRERTMRWLGRIFFVFIVIGWVMAVGWYVLFSDAFRVLNVEVITESSRTREEIAGFVEEYLQKKVWGIFPGDALLLVRNSDMERAIGERFDSLRFVQVEKKLHHTVVISTEERSAALVWCPLQNYSDAKKRAEKDDENKDFEIINTPTENIEALSRNTFESGEDEFESTIAAMSAENRCFVADASGDVYRETTFGSEFSNEYAIPIVIAMNGFAPPIGGEVLDEEAIRILSLIPKAFRESFYVETANVFRMPTSFAREVTVRTKEGWDVVIPTDMPLEESLLTIKTFLVRVDDAKNRSQLRSVDVRVSGKIFYVTETSERAVREDVKEDDDMRVSE